ncbi:MAG TPA: tRNA pseudouridine(38-40) synthase TruA, partial [Eubacteriales bacterium]|nr:tRNA pseudouridine(38-40) synthase TruA [Eubacteriales bacterium]
RLPLKDLFAVRISLMPDLEKMRAAARHIAGEHDFSAFLASGSVVKNTVRTVYSLEIAEKSGDIEITVEGNGFLYNMVRIIAGTLLYAGTGKIAPEEIPDILALGDRKRAGKTMPAKGLSLLCVEYD